MSSVALYDVIWCMCVYSYLYSLEKSRFLNYQLFLESPAFNDDYINVTLIGDKHFEICEGAAMEYSSQNNRRTHKEPGKQAEWNIWKTYMQ